MSAISPADDGSPQGPDATLCQSFGYFVPLYSVSDINLLPVRPGFREDISELVEVTRKTVKERLQGDAWIMWAIVQRANLPVKIEACIT